MLTMRWYILNILLINLVYSNMYNATTVSLCRDSLQNHILILAKLNIEILDRLDFVVQARLVSIAGLALKRSYYIALN